MGSARRPCRPRYAAPALRSLWRTSATGFPHTETIFLREGPPEPVRGGGLDKWLKREKHVHAPAAIWTCLRLRVPACRNNGGVRTLGVACSRCLSSTYPVSPDGHSVASAVRHLPVLVRGTSLAPQPASQAFFVSTIPWAGNRRRRDRRCPRQQP